jgi:hypothetical protein
VGDNTPVGESEPAALVARIIDGADFDKAKVRQLPAGDLRKAAEYLLGRPPENRQAMWQKLLNGRDPAEAERMRAAVAEASRQGCDKLLTPAGDVVPRVTITAAEVQEVKLDWLWLGRIPLGKLTLFAGENDLGKSFVLCDIAKRVTTGTAWPDHPGIPNDDVGSVILISGEDDVSDTLKPRLRWARANLGKVRFLAPETLGQWTLSDLDTLKRAVDEAGDCRLIMIDPATAFVGKVDDHKTSQLRSVLTPLTTFAAERRVAIIMVTHTGKADYLNAANKILGSVGWRNAVRAAWMFFADPEDGEGRRRLMLRIKSNLSEDCGGLAYRIEKEEFDNEVRVMVRWEKDAVRDHADDVLARQKRRAVAEAGSNDASRAAEWLKAKLEGGPQPAGDSGSPTSLAAQGNAALGIDRRYEWWRDTVLKRLLGGKSDKARGKNAPWYWCLPGQTPPRRNSLKNTKNTKKWKNTKKR